MLSTAYGTKYLVNVFIKYSLFASLLLKILVARMRDSKNYANLIDNQIPSRTGNNISHSFNSHLPIPCPIYFSHLCDHSCVPSHLLLHFSISLFQCTLLCVPFTNALFSLSSPKLAQVEVFKDENKDSSEVHCEAAVPGSHSAFTRENTWNSEFRQDFVIMNRIATPVTGGTWHMHFSGSTIPCRGSHRHWTVCQQGLFPLCFWLHNWLWHSHLCCPVFLVSSVKLLTVRLLYKDMLSHFFKRILKIHIC